MRITQSLILGISLLCSGYIVNAQTTTNTGQNSGTGGTNNSFFGYKTGEITTANYNSFFGANSGISNSTGTNNSFFGALSGLGNTTGSKNLFLGSSSGASNSTGFENTFAGAFSGRNNKTGKANSFFGMNSGHANSTGSFNSFFGKDAGRSNTSGSYNMFFGAGSGYSMKTGNFNLFTGYQTGSKNVSGYGNTFLGQYAGSLNVSGHRNVFIGIYAGYKNLGSSNVFIGNEAGKNELSSNKLYIENSSASIPLVYGDFATNKVGINTKTFPANTTFAVGGDARIFGNIKAIQGEFEALNPAQDVSGIADWRDRMVYNTAFQVGQILDTSPSGFDLRMIQFLDFNNSFMFNMADQSNHARFRYTAEVAGKSDFNLFDKDQKLIWNVYERGEDKIMSMPTSNAKFRIRRDGWYLPEHTMVVNGSTMLEGDVFSTGTIGIGTTTLDATYKLLVNGKVRAKEVTVETGWSDYVFFDDYKLPTLSEVEQHIKEKGHLINIPSAEEVEKNGIELGAINAKLLEKIEELTLYTIDQDKKLREQEERLQKLEALINKK